MSVNKMLELFILVPIVNSVVSAAYIDLKFDLKLKHVPTECRRIPLSSNDTCRLSYAIIVLHSMAGDFDLQAKMLQDGFVKHFGKERRHFREDTVVPLTSAALSGDSSDIRVYVGVKFYGLPKSAQDYFVMDVSKLIRRPTLKTVTSVDSNDMSFVAVAKYGKTKVVNLNDVNSNAKSCGCSGYTCSCCEHLDIPKISLNETGCLNITYLPNDYGISFTLSLNNLVVYNDTISARNPPPVCFNVPYLKEYASLCIRFYKLDVSKTHFDGCARVEAELLHVRVGEKELGCFHLGPKKLLDVEVDMKRI